MKAQAKEVDRIVWSLCPHTRIHGGRATVKATSTAKEKEVSSKGKDPKAEERARAVDVERRWRR